MNDHSISTEAAISAMKASPPVAVAATAVVGVIDWQMWVLILTALYLVMQIVWLGWRYVDKFRGEEVGEDG